MIDWWPWWVTTAIAAPVALAVLAFALLARGRARFALGLVGLAAVAVAAAAPAVMGEGGSSPAAMAGGGERLTAPEFARRADANCAALNAFTAGLGEWPDATDLPGTARFLQAWLPEVHQALAAQGRLRPPLQEQRTFAAWMDSMTAIGHAMEAVRYSARAGDAEGVRAGYAAADAASARSATLSKELGLKVCFS